jgi:hypothetical protein
MPASAADKQYSGYDGRLPECDEDRLLNRFLGREVEGGGVVFEVAFVGAVAEGLVLGLAAAAEADDLAAAESVRLAVTVYYLEISFNL